MKISEIKEGQKFRIHGNEYSHIKVSGEKPVWIKGITESTGYIKVHVYDSIGEMMEWHGHLKANTEVELVTDSTQAAENEIQKLQNSTQEIQLSDKAIQAINSGEISGINSHVSIADTMINGTDLQGNDMGIPDTNGVDINGKHLWEKMASANMTGDQLREELQKVAMKEQIQKIKDRNTPEESKMLIDKLIAEGDKVRFPDGCIMTYLPVTEDSNSPKWNYKNGNDKVETYGKLEEIIEDVIRIQRWSYNDIPNPKGIGYVVNKLQATKNTQKYIQNGTE